MNSSNVATWIEERMPPEVARFSTHTTLEPSSWGNVESTVPVRISFRSSVPSGLLNESMGMFMTYLSFFTP